MGLGKIRLNMTADSELEIKEAFQRAQKAHHNKAKLVAGLRSRYLKLEDKSAFHDEFLRCLKYAMIIYKREPAVENIIDFATKFATSFETATSEEEPAEEDEEENPFLHFLLTFLLESHSASSHAVRFRVCQLINKVLGSLSEEAQIDDELCERIHQAMLVRVTDKFPNVRIQAALAMARLQDPSDPQCPTITAYVLILENDSNPEVRRAVLSCIAPSAVTLPKIYRRTRDVKEKVRRLAYQVLAEKVHIRALTIAQRVSLLQQGLNDSAESVREVVRDSLLASWLRLLQGDVLQLLHKLDVENCPDTAVRALHTLFSAQNDAQELLTRAPLPLDHRRLIPVEALTCENVLYWRAVCEFVKSKGDEGEEMLEQLLPEAAIFAEYLYSYLKSIPLLTEEQRSDFVQLEQVMTREFMGQQLLRLTQCMDTAEEGGRKRVLAVLQEMLVLSNTPTSLVALLVEKLVSLLQDDTQRIQTVAEIISDLREPIVPMTEPVNEKENREKQVRLAEVRVRLLEAKQELEDCVSAQDFTRAAQLKDSITQLELLRMGLAQEGALQAEPKETRVEKNDPETLLKCLTMCAEVMKQVNIKRGVCPTMSGLIESLVLPCVSNTNPAVRNLAVLCLGTCALHSKDLSNTHLVLLLQITQLDEPKVQASALRAVMDLLLLNGFHILQDGPTPRPTDRSPDRADGRGDEPTAEDERGAVQSVLKLLSDFLDSEVSELRTEAAEGLARLLYCGRICSPKLLSRLILLWYNPVTEDDQRLRHCLGVFLQLYARESRAHQECVEESFLPTMRTLFNAPVTSPLSEVDVSNVAELLVELTRSSTLMQPSTDGAGRGVSVHSSLALRVCHEVLRDASAPEVRLYCRTLSSLELSADEPNAELLLLLQGMLQEVKDKICVRAIEKILEQQTGGVRPKPPSSPQDGTLQTLDDNAGEFVNDDDAKPSKKPKRGPKRVTTARAARKNSKAKDSSDESDGENVPEPPVSARPSRRAKMTAREKTKQDLTALMNREANGS